MEVYLHMNKIQIVLGMDWQALYVNGVLERECKYIKIGHIKQHVPIETIEIKSLSGKGNEEVNGLGHYPVFYGEMENSWFKGEFRRD